jgi:hypothetical protein
VDEFLFLFQTWQPSSDRALWKKSLVRALDKLTEQSIDSCREKALLLVLANRLSPG